MRTVAILPVKTFSAAKQRLREGVSPDRRVELVEAMFTDVLMSVRDTIVDLIVVVTGSPAARAIAIRCGARVVADQETGHNDAARVGIDAALAWGAERALLVPGDCPAVERQEVDALLCRPATSPSVLIVPDRHGTGTNALLLTPPNALEPSFGPGSCQRHLSSARSRGIHAEVIELPSLALDIDTPEDLDALAAHTQLGAQTERLLTAC